jgi:hypothetical protein
MVTEDTYIFIESLCPVVNLFVRNPKLVLSNLNDADESYVVGLLPTAIVLPTYILALNPPYEPLSAALELVLTALIVLVLIAVILKKLPDALDENSP